MLLWGWSKASCSICRESFYIDENESILNVFRLVYARDNSRVLDLFKFTALSHYTFVSHLDKISICHRIKSAPKQQDKHELNWKSKRIDQSLRRSGSDDDSRFFFTQLVKLNVVHHLIKLVRSLLPAPRYKHRAATCTVTSLIFVARVIICVRGQQMKDDSELKRKKALTYLGAIGRRCRLLHRIVHSHCVSFIGIFCLCDSAIIYSIGSVDEQLGDTGDCN